jgi:hypothetical protein
MTKSSPLKGWQSIEVANGLPGYNCFNRGDDFRASIEADELVANRGGVTPANVPLALQGRMSATHAQSVRYVFASADGWVVMFDQGEFGGGIEWYDAHGGDPRSILVGQRHDDDFVPQNVNRALALGDSLYVLQGLSHLTLSAGQIAKVWREHDHFSSHVIARYQSEPFDWIHDLDGTWLVATREGIWRTSETGSNELFARFPAIVLSGTSFARAPSGTFYVGMRSGILRLTPKWADAPRYETDFLVPGAYAKDCRPTKDE